MGRCSRGGSFQKEIEETISREVGERERASRTKRNVLWQPMSREMALVFLFFFFFSLCSSRTHSCEPIARPFPCAETLKKRDLRQRRDCLYYIRGNLDLHQRCSLDPLWTRPKKLNRCSPSRRGFGKGFRRFSVGLEMR